MRPTVSEERAPLDPVTLEVIRNSLPAIANEMSYDLQRTSYNMMIYEVRDYCCALLTPDGRLISQNIGGVSHFVSDLGVVIRDGVERRGAGGFEPGDAFITNHQKVAGQHLNNMVVYTPVIHDGGLVAFAAVRAHWVDVGGTSTGFGASGLVTDPWIEGLQLDQLRLYHAGRLDEQLLAVIRDNIRYPESSLGDLRAQLAACRLAERRFQELLGRYGRDTALTGIERVFDEAEARCRQVVEAIPDGEYRASSRLDHDHVERDRPVPIEVRVMVDGGSMTIDLTGCSPQRRGAINARTLAGAYVAYKAITTPLEPVNEGSFRALRVEIQEGNFMMARYPAPMASWSTALPTVVDTVLAALAPAMPDRIPAAHLGALGGPVVFFGFDPRYQRRFVVQSIEGGGWGGRPWEDGESATVSVCQGDVRNAPVEAIELKCPVLVESRELRADSGGAGRHRGGLGLATRVTNLVEGYWNLSSVPRRTCPPWGLWGGRPGADAGHLLRLRPDQEFRAVEVQRQWVEAGATAVVLTAGGGGWGEPLDRPPDEVLEDVLEGYVSVEAARERYGVVIDGEGGDELAVNEEATRDLRARRRRADA
jgi:N-methylhydantoinase B